MKAGDRYRALHLEGGWSRPLVAVGCVGVFIQVDGEEGKVGEFNWHDNDPQLCRLDEGVGSDSHWWMLMRDVKKEPKDPGVNP